MSLLMCDVEAVGYKGPFMCDVEVGVCRMMWYV